MRLSLDRLGQNRWVGRLKDKQIKIGSKQNLELEFSLALCICPSISKTKQKKTKNNKILNYWHILLIGMALVVYYFVFDSFIALARATH